MAESPSRHSEDSFRSAKSTVSETQRFSPEQEAALLKESNAQKAAANKLYGSAAFSEAIGEYDKALSSCPNYLEYEIAVLKSNIAACHIKLSEWKEAVTAAAAAIDGLERLQPQPKKKDQADAKASPLAPAAKGKADTIDENAVVVELDDDDDTAAQELAALQLSDERKAQIRALRAKSLMRRARANCEQGGWGALASAEEDYKVVLSLNVVPAADQRFIRQQLVKLPERINQAKETEMGEMMGKLKELGNGILKPFGLSTDMFQFQQDPNTGGYNMSFGGNSKG